MRREVKTRAIHQAGEQCSHLGLPADLDYPQRYRRRLKEAAPPILFYAGNQKLIKLGGLALPYPFPEEFARLPEWLKSAAESAPQKPSQVELF